MSQNQRSAPVQARHATTHQQVWNLTLQANLNIMQRYDTERPRLGEALRRNIQSAQVALGQHNRNQSPHYILEEFIFYEFSILENWNLTRLGYTVSFDEPEGRYDLFDDSVNFPLRSAARQAGITVQARSWLRVRSHPQPPPEHDRIVQDFMRSPYADLTASARQVLYQRGFGPLLDGNQQQPPVPAPVQQPLGVLAPQPAVRPPRVVASPPSVHGASNRLHAPASIDPRHRADVLPPLVPQAAQVARPIPQVVQPQPPIAPAVRPTARPAPAPASAAPARPALPAAPAASAGPAAAQQATGTQRGQHVGIKDAPSPNLPFPANAKITLPEMFAFTPQWLRSVDVINRVWQNGGGQKALANVVTAHRKNPVAANTLWHIIKPELEARHPGRKARDHPRNLNYRRDSINVTVLRLRPMTQANGAKRGDRHMYPSHSIPFRQLADNVKHFPTGSDALDLTRCVQYVVDHPDQCNHLMFPDDYDAVLAIVGGGAPVTNQHFDGAAITRWAGTIGGNRAQGKDAMWETECAQHKATYWPPNPAAPVPAANNGMPAAGPALAALPVPPAPAVQAPVAPLPSVHGSRKRPRNDHRHDAPVAAPNDDGPPIMKRPRTQHPNGPPVANGGPSAQILPIEPLEEEARIERARQMMMSGQPVVHQGLPDYQQGLGRPAVLHHQDIPQFLEYLQHVGPVQHPGRFQHPGPVPYQEGLFVNDRVPVVSEPPENPTPAGEWLLQQPVFPHPPGGQSSRAPPQHRIDLYQPNDSQIYGYHPQLDDQLPGIGENAMFGEDQEYRDVPQRPMQQNILNQPQNVPEGYAPARPYVPPEHYNTSAQQEVWNQEDGFNQQDVPEGYAPAMPYVPPEHYHASPQRESWNQEEGADQEDVADQQSSGSVPHLPEQSKKRARRSEDDGISPRPYSRKRARTSEPDHTSAPDPTSEIDPTSESDATSESSYDGDSITEEELNAIFPGP